MLMEYRLHFVDVGRIGRILSLHEILNSVSKRTISAIMAVSRSLSETPS